MTNTEHKFKRKLPLSTAIMHYLSVPVIAGIGVGIVMVLLFALAPSPFSTTNENQFSNNRVHYVLTLDGLKNHYRVGEKLNFALHLKGYGNSCGSPNVLINNQNGTTLYTLYVHGIFACDAGNYLVDTTWTLKALEAPENLSLTEAGNYSVVGSFHGAEVVTNITVS